jgi:uncharacterized membrane protein
MSPANGYVVLATLLSGWLFLFFARWVGIVPATLGALLFALSPDNLRVSFAESNLPRALATALLPALAYCMFCLLGEEGRKRHAIVGALLVAAIIVSHAMMAAIFGVGLGLVSSVLLLLRGGPFRRLFRALAPLAIGLALSGSWWLPSLTGGITELNQSAVTEALAIFPITTYLNPRLRYRDHEILYVGWALTAIWLLSVLRCEGRQSLSLACLGVGVVTVLISWARWTGRLRPQTRELDCYPRVSISIPVLNGERTLGGCLASIQAQTYPLDLLEVVDNGSPDGQTHRPAPTPNDVWWIP